MTDTLTLSETGIALILLEQELRNNHAEVARWERRLSGILAERGAAERRVLETKAKIRLIKESLNEPLCRCSTHYG
jgi:hypothetical protein